METETFVKRSRLEASAHDVFQWHLRPGAFERLSPPWERVRVVERTGGIENGGRLTLKVSVGLLRPGWVAEHYGYVVDREFRDRQVSGPFRKWEHLHRVEEDGPRASFLEDRVEYVTPLGLGRDYVRRRLERVRSEEHT